MVCIPILLMGVYMMTGRGAFLIAGYNTSSPTEKARFNGKKLTKAMGVMIFLCMLTFILGIESSLSLDVKGLVWAVVLVSALLLFIGMCYVGNSPRFRQEPRQ